MSQSYRLKSKRANEIEIKIKPSRHFIANAISSCFASAAMKYKPNVHICSENNASAAAICSQGCRLAVNVSVVYLQIARIISSRILAAKLL